MKPLGFPQTLAALFNTAPAVTPHSPGKKQTFCWLRWVLIIASAYLFLFSLHSPDTLPALALMISFALSSNLFLYRLPEQWMERPGFDVALILFDTLWVSLAALLTQSLSGDFFLLYFLIILLAVVGECLEVIALGTILIGVLYTGILAFGPSPSLLATPTYSKVTG